MTNRNWGFCLLSLAFLYSNPLFAAQEHDHNHAEESVEAEHSDGQGHEEEQEEENDHKEGPKDEQGHEEENRVHLNKEQRMSAGILVETLTANPVPMEIEGPGEILLNAYATSQVTPRIEAQVVERHAFLGDHVSKEQPLITLSSVSMAEAQGALLIAAQEWQRVKKLGKKVVSDRRYLEAQIAFQQARAKLLAYGMTTGQIDRLTKTNSITQAKGRFSLLSPQEGTVIQDDFIIGQMVEPGDLLFELTDESKLWVEARINPESISYLSIGVPAYVQVGGKTSIVGKVIQIHHALDETTRTLAVRLEIPNPGDLLHPGQFVIARIQTSESGEIALTLPLDAVLRSPDGDWQVFVEVEPGEFEPKEVELVRQVSGLVVIEGLEPGTRVVTQGAFFVQSELAKSGFEVHNH